MKHLNKILYSTFLSCICLTCFWSFQQLKHNENFSFDYNDLLELFTQEDQFVELIIFYSCIYIL